MFINAGGKGIGILYDCLKDVFYARARNTPLLLNVVFKVILYTKDTHLISILETILQYGRNLVKGDPKPPAWAPTLDTDISGGGKYGWGDEIWIPIAHKVAEFLVELLPQLPAVRWFL